MMTSRERIKAVMSGRMPDRPPWLEFGFHTDIAEKIIGHKMPRISTGFHPDEDLARYSGELDSLIEAVQKVGIDTVWLKHWGSSYGNFSGLKGTSDEGGIIKNIEDWQNALTYIPDPKNTAWYKCVEIFVERVRKTDLAMGFTANLCLEDTLRAFGFSNFCMSVYDNPDLIKIVLDWYVSNNRRIVRDFFKYEPDIIVLGDDIAFGTGPFVSPKDFRNLFLPRMKLVAQECVIPWVYHSDGNLLPVMEDILSLGMIGLHPIEPYGTMDIVEIKKRFGNRIIPVGNLDMNIIANGNTTDISNGVTELFKSVGFDGRWIMASSNSVDKGANIQNLYAIGNTLKELKY